jgi:hypothetical protein
MGERSMKINFSHGQGEQYESPSFNLEAETDFERRFLQAAFLRRLRGHGPCIYQAVMILDERDCGTGEVAFRCLDNGLEPPYHFGRDADPRRT